MAFFGNAAINLLNAHYALRNLATAGGGAFSFVYLLKAGVAAPVVLIVLALILLGRFAVRPLLARLGVRYGLRGLLAAGTLATALQYPLLAEVSGVGLALAVLIALSALGDTVYWTCYHAYFAALGDDAQRGHQLGAREAIGALISVASPVLTGWLLVTFGPRTAFGVSGVIAAVSVLPLLRAPAVQVARRPIGVLRTARQSMLLFAADGWMAASYVFVWQIALFQSLGESYLAYGGTLALAALAGVLAGPLLGRLIDAGHGQRAALYASVTFALVICLRALAVGDAALAVLANAAGALVSGLYNPALMTAVYTQAKRSPCPLRFHIATEGGWDAGGASGLLLAALAIWLGMPLSAGVLMALGGVAVSFVGLHRYYAAQGRDGGA